MRYRFTIVILALFVLMLPFGELPPTFVYAAGQNSYNLKAFVPGEVIVGFIEKLDKDQMLIVASALANEIGAMVADISAGAALLSFDEDVDVLVMTDQLRELEGMAYAEPNYIAWIPELAAAESMSITTISRSLADGRTIELTVDELRSMRSIQNGKIRSTYPNDPDVWTNWGWFWVGSQIIWPYKPAGKMVCVLDTGVDWDHPDLNGRVVKGYDFVNDDANPQDDHGHGTHVAGIIAAKASNGRGIAGVSNGKVMAVKVLNAQGIGTYWDIAAGMRYCANKPAVKVINTSFGGYEPSTTLESAVAYAVNVKGKLIVASAGNDGYDCHNPPGDPQDYPCAYPAYYVTKPDYSYGMLAVGALAEEDICRASFSNHGAWVAIVAPGESIYSTLPHSQSFWLGQNEGYQPNYDWLSGTSMATSFVAAGAARVWGAYPSFSQSEVKARLLTTGRSVLVEGDCWPSTMSESVELDVAAAMNRTAITGQFTDAVTGLPLKGATAYVYANSSLLGTARLASNFSSFWDVINLPFGSTFAIKISRAGYTWGKIKLGNTTPPAPGWYWLDETSTVASVPPKVGISVVANWRGGYDLNLCMWLPIENPNGPAIITEMEGNLRDHPYAKSVHDAGALDWLGAGTMKIKSRAGHSSWPYYQGDYDVFLYDVGTEADPPTPYFPQPVIVRIWQGGKIKQTFFYGCPDTDPEGDIGPYWYIATLNNGIISEQNVCGGLSITPYAEPIDGTAGVPEIGNPKK